MMTRGINGKNNVFADLLKVAYFPILPGISYSSSQDYPFTVDNTVFAVRPGIFSPRVNVKMS